MGGILTISDQEQILAEREGTGCNKCTLWVRGIRGWGALTMNQRRQILTERTDMVCSKLTVQNKVGRHTIQVYRRGRYCMLYVFFVDK